VTLPADIIAELTERGQTVATAESLTAGMVCVRLTEVPGASAVVRGGLVVYATDLKASLAGVDEKLLKRHGAVHPEVASQLARGARVRCGADWGLGLTGLAGPGEQDGVEAGTVHIGLAAGANVTGGDVTGDETIVVRSFRFKGDRARVREASTAAALDLLREHLGLPVRSLLA
jgi:nicotinamide-nucleotide amidase